MPAFVLAHQGGWDEVLYFLVPIVIALVLLRVAERRARRRAAAAASPTRPQPDGEGHDPPSGS